VSDGERRTPARNATPAPHRDRWLLSYGDFLTLLLALFVVLYASARVDAEKNRGMFEGLQMAFVPGSPASEIVSPDPTGGLGRRDEGELQQLAMRSGSLVPLAQLEAGLMKRIDRERERLDGDPGVSLHRTDRGLVISLAAAEYFPAGGASIPESRKRVLAAIAPLLAAEEGSLHFEGHTDDRGVAGSGYPSNWELSSARAAAVARYFIDEHGIDPRRVATTGYAAYHPITDGITPAERARNRRVEIVVLADEPAGKGGPSDSEQDLDRLLRALPPLAGTANGDARRPAKRPAAPEAPRP